MMTQVVESIGSDTDPDVIFMPDGSFCYVDRYQNYDFNANLLATWIQPTTIFWYARLNRDTNIISCENIHISSFIELLN